MTAESKVTEGHAASVPAEVRRALGIEPGDYLVWEVHGDAVTVVARRTRRPVFQDFDGFDFGFDTGGAEDHDEVN